jgi:hypothetical protein
MRRRSWRRVALAVLCTLGLSGWSAVLLPANAGAASGAQVVVTPGGEGAAGATWQVDVPLPSSLQPGTLYGVELQDSLGANFPFDLGQYTLTTTTVEGTSNGPVLQYEQELPQQIVQPNPVAVTALGSGTSSFGWCQLASPYQCVPVLSGTGQVVIPWQTPDASAGPAVHLHIQISGVQNPGSGGTDQVTVTLLPASGLITLTGFSFNPITQPVQGSVQLLSGPTISATTLLAAAPGVTWTIRFYPVDDIPGSATLTIQDALGATFSSVASDYTFTEVDTGQSFHPVQVQASTGKVALTLPAGAGTLLAAGQPVSLQMLATVNPPVPSGTDRITVLGPSTGHGPQWTEVGGPFQLTATLPPPPGTGTGPQLALGEHPMTPLPPQGLPTTQQNTAQGVGAGTGWSLQFAYEAWTPNGDPSRCVDEVSSQNNQQVCGAPLAPNIILPPGSYPAAPASPECLNPASDGSCPSGAAQGYLISSPLLQIPVVCPTPPAAPGGHPYSIVCNVQVTDGQGNPLPITVTNVQGGGAVSDSFLFGAPSTGGIWKTTKGEITQYEVNVQPQGSPSVQTNVPAVTFAMGEQLNGSSPGTLSPRPTDGSTAATGVTMAPLPFCSGGSQTVSLDINIPLVDLSSTVEIQTTEAVTDLSAMATVMTDNLTGGIMPNATADNCQAAAYVAAALLNTVPAMLDLQHPQNTCNIGGWATELDTTLRPGSPNDGEPFSCISTSGLGTALDINAMTLTVAHAPTAGLQFNVMPYKILYAPPGDRSQSSFTLTQGQETETEFHLDQETKTTTTIGNKVGASVGLDVLEGVFDIKDTFTWDQNTTTSAAQGTATSQGLAWSSETTQSWSSYQGLQALDQPGSAPWMFDEFVLQVHPQFAVWDDWYCPDGGTPAPTSSDPTACSNGEPPVGTTQYTMLAAEPVQFDVSAGELLTCAEGNPLPIPGTGGETLPPSECYSLLALDPFSPAASAAGQAQDPTQLAGVGNLAIPEGVVARGQPGLGTNGSYEFELSSSQKTTNGSTHTSTFTTSIDSTISNSVEASTKIPVVEGLDLTASASYEYTQTSGLEMSISYEQSQTTSQVVQSAAKAELEDESNPIDTQIFLDTRWDTLMFQVPQPQVSGVSPSGGPASGGTVVTLSGANFWSGPVGVEFCPVGGGACTSGTQVDPKTDIALTVRTPALSPGEYQVVVLTTGGTSACTATSGGCLFSVVVGGESYQANPPAVAAITPDTGQTGGGTTVTITGANLGDVTQVWFGAEDPQVNPGLYHQFLSSGSPSRPPVSPAPFAVLSNTEIVACAPPVAQAGALWVSVFSPTRGWSSVTASDQFTYRDGPGTACSPLASAPPNPPTVTAVSPSGGPVQGGTTVTITGTGFAPLQEPVACTLDQCPADSQAVLLLPPPVDFCAPDGLCVAATAVQVLSPNTITAVAPAAPEGPGTVDVLVGNSAGFSAANAGDHFTYVQAPLACGGVLTIFLPGALQQLLGIPCPAPGSLGLSAAPVNVAAGLESAQLTANVLDANGNPMPALPVTVVTDFGNLSVPSAVYGAVYSTVYGETYQTVLTTDATGQVQSLFSAAGPGTANVTAWVYAPTPLANHVQVHFYDVPIVTNLSVHSGPSSGGTTVTVFGTGFEGATSVYFGTAPVSQIQVNPSGTAITVASPPGLGTVDVRVANPAAESPAVPGDLFTYTFGSGQGGVTFSPPPTVGAVQPRLGPAAGGQTVTVTGSGFSGVQQVRFGPYPASSFTVLSDNSLQVTSPPGAGSVDVTVVGPGGASTPGPQDQYTYLPVPQVTGLSPAWGPPAGGTQVQISGTGLRGVTQVLFGGTPASFTVRSDAELVATAPAGQAGVTVDVTVVAPCVAGSGACGTSPTVPADQFTYLPLPTVTGVSPGAGPLAGGNAVSIFGTGLRTTSAVLFGGVAATGFAVDSDGQVTATAPPGTAGTVDITVTTDCSGSLSAVPTSCGTSRVGPADQYTYSAGPVVTAIAPVNGPVSGGTQVTIQGNGLGNATAVFFGDTQVQFQVVAASGGAELVATAPPSPSPQTVHVTVQVACSLGGSVSCGTSPTTAADRFTYLGLPVVSGLTPASGPSGGGTTVSVEGSGFTTAQHVYFGGVAAAFQVVSDTQILATAPAGQGTVDVIVDTNCATTQTANATSCGPSATGPADLFTYFPATVQAITRLLGPGWNTLSIPFPLANPDLRQILSDGAKSVLAAYLYDEGHWVPLNEQDEHPLTVPMTGMYLFIGCPGGASSCPNFRVTATFIPISNPPGSPSQPPAPSGPSALRLDYGWNLVGPSAAAGSESYRDFLASTETGQVPLLIDPNGPTAPVTNPNLDGTDRVLNTYAYWVFANDEHVDLVGQILLGRANPPREGAP